MNVEINKGLNISIVLMLIIMAMVNCGCKEEDVPYVVEQAKSELYVDIKDIMTSGITSSDYHFRIVRYFKGDENEYVILDTLFSKIQWPVELELGWTYKLMAESTYNYRRIYKDKNGKTKTYAFTVLSSDSSYKYELDIIRPTKCNIIVPVYTTTYRYVCTCDSDSCTHSVRIPFQHADYVDSY